MRLTKALPTTALLFGTLFAGAALLSPAKAQAQFGIGIEVGRPAYGYVHAPAPYAYAPYGYHRDFARERWLAERRHAEWVRAQEFRYGGPGFYDRHRDGDPRAFDRGYGYGR